MQVKLKRTGQHAQQGVGQRHGQHVGQRQRQPAPGADSPGPPDDNAGQDGNHREHARGQRQQHAEGEKCQHVEDETALLQAGGDAVLYGEPPRADGLQSGARDTFQGYTELLQLRRVAHRLVLATLVADLQQGGGDAGAGVAQRHIHRDLSGMYFHPAEGFILFDGAARHAHSRALHAHAVRQGSEGKLVAIKVVPLLDDPVKPHCARAQRGCRQAEGLIRVQDAKTAQVVAGRTDQILQALADGLRARGNGNQT